MKTYHLDLLEDTLKSALNRYCELCDLSPERQYLSSETVFTQTQEIVQLYLLLFKEFHFLDRETTYYRQGFLLTYDEEEDPSFDKSDDPEILQLLREAYGRIAATLPQERIFLPIHVRRAASREIQIFIGTVTKEEHRHRICIVSHQTVYPRPTASVGNTRYHYLVKLMEAYEPEEDGALHLFFSSKGLDHRHVQKDSRQFFGNTFYRQYLTLKMIRVVGDLLFSTLSHKEIAYQNGLTGYKQLYALFHLTYDFPIHRIPRIALSGLI